MSTKRIRALDNYGRNQDRHEAILKGNGTYGWNCPASPIFVSGDGDQSEYVPCFDEING